MVNGHRHKSDPGKLRGLSIAYIARPMYSLFLQLANPLEHYFSFLLKTQLAVTIIACLIAIGSMLHVYLKQSKLLKSCLSAGDWDFDGLGVSECHLRERFG